MQRLFNSGIQEQLSSVKVSPTFGVSFGLPQSGDYPINPLTGHPIVNPYGPSISGNGVKLGPVAVNPLIAFQVSKDESGDKVLKPLVNLHVTPTHGFIHKLGGIKHKILDHLSHDHHYHDYYPHVHTYEKPHDYHSHDGFYSKPYYPSSFNHYGGSYDYYESGHSHPSYGYSGSGHEYGYDKYINDDDDDNYYRNGKSLNITARPGLTDIQADNAYNSPFSPPASSSTSYQSSSNYNQHSSEHVSFPRNRRDVSGNPIEKVSTPKLFERRLSGCCQFVHFRSI